jgi:hypothetical protein
MKPCVLIFALLATTIPATITATIVPIPHSCDYSTCQQPNGAIFTNDCDAEIHDEHGFQSCGNYSGDNQFPTLVAYGECDASSDQRVPKPWKWHVVSDASGVSATGYITCTPNGPKIPISVNCGHAPSGLLTPIVAGANGAACGRTGPGPTGTTSSACTCDLAGSGSLMCSTCLAGGPCNVVFPTE